MTDAALSVIHLRKLRAEMDRLIKQVREWFADDSPTRATKFRLLVERDYRRAHDRVAEDFERDFPGVHIRRSTDPRPLPP